MSPPGFTHLYEVARLKLIVAGLSDEQVEVRELNEVVMRVAELDIGQLLMKKPQILTARTQRRQLQTRLEGAAPAYFCLFFFFPIVFGPGFVDACLYAPTYPSDDTRMRNEGLLLSRSLLIQGFKLDQLKCI
ncbi:hypothetical protein JCGZ_03261 [Jatropha curcas]|uniref:Uncharacterized protein n=1 Tax=Jatropha curcas TaxID=180498 RepID=A0A067JQG4_JATCU|nr:hypothetical protein JCGZ_03261 [Jatropha curcas]